MHGSGCALEIAGIDGDGLVSGASDESVVVCRSGNEGDEACVNNDLDEAGYIRLDLDRDCSQIEEEALDLISDCGRSGELEDAAVMSEAGKPIGCGYRAEMGGCGMRRDLLRQRSCLRQRCRW